MERHEQNGNSIAGARTTAGSEEARSHIDLGINIMDAAVGVESLDDLLKKGRLSMVKEEGRCHLAQE